MPGVVGPTCASAIGCPHLLVKSLDRLPTGFATLTASYCLVQSLSSPAASGTVRLPHQRELATAAALALPRFVSATVRFHTAVADRLGVTPAELHCLQLVHSGTTDSPTELARLLGMTTGAFTRLLDRMERARLVERAPDPADRRRLRVRALPDRMAELTELYAPLAQRFGDHLAGFDRRQLTALVAFLTDGEHAADLATTEVTAAPAKTRLTGAPGGALT